MENLFHVLVFNLFKGERFKMALKHYKNSDSTVFNDAKALFDLNKNILLKGPTGSGKTKLAETLSEVVDITHASSQLFC